MRRLITPFIALLFVSMVEAATAQVSKKTPVPAAAADVQRGMSLAESGHCAEALPLLKKSAPLITDKELKRTASFAAIKCAMGLNQQDIAVDFLRILNHEFPHDPEVLYLSTHAYSDLSIRASEELLYTAPSSFQVHQLNAEALETQGKWDEAAAEYRGILQKNPRLAGIHFRLGRVLLYRPDPPAAVVDEARREFQQELEIDPKNAGAEYVLGELARQNSQWTEAIEHFSRATKLDAGFGDAFLALGSSLVSSKKFSEAIVPLETAVKLQPTNPTAHYQLAIAYTRVGRKQDADREAALHKQLSENASETSRKVEEGVEGTQEPAPPK